MERSQCYAFWLRSKVLRKNQKENPTGFPMNMMRDAGNFKKVRNLEESLFSKTEENKK